MRRKIIYNKLYKIYIGDMHRGIISILVIVLMLSATCSPLIASYSKAEGLPNLDRDSFEEKIGEAKSKIKSLISKSIEGDDTIVILSGKPDMKRQTFFSRFVYLFLRYGKDEKWIKVDRLAYAMARIKGKNGITLDVDNDGTKDVYLDFKFIPKIVRRGRIAFAYDTYLVVKRISSCSLSKARSFEVKLYFYLPKIFSEKLISIGYRSPIGSGIPDYCKVDHLFIPHIFNRGYRDKYVSLQYIVNDPSAKVVMLSGEGGEESGWTAVESGHISIGGALEVEVDGTFNINGTEVTLEGQFYLDTKNGTVDIWWNTTRGYFKMNGSCAFRVEDLHFSAENKLTFDVDSLSMDAKGYVEVDQSGKTGNLLIDGTGNIQGLSFDIDVNENETKFSGNLELSGCAVLDNFMLSWGESGFSAGGSINGDVIVNLTNFLLSSQNFTVTAGKISLSASLDLEFMENGEIVLCSISSAGASIENLYVKYGEHGTTLDHIDIEGVLVIDLEMIISGEEYLQSEEGHISVSGNTVMNVSVVTNVNGTNITLIGLFHLNTGEDSVDIWWNTTQGYLKVNGSGYFSVEKFFISIEDMGILSLDKLTLDAGGCLIVNESGAEGNVYVRGLFYLEGLKIAMDVNTGTNDSKQLIFKGSFGFSMNAMGWISIEWNESAFSIDGRLSSNAETSLTIENLYLSYSGLLASADLIVFDASAGLEFSKSRLTLSVPYVGGGIENLYISYNNSTTLSLKHLSVGGSGSLMLLANYLQVNAVASLEIEGLRVSSSGIGSLCIGYLFADGSASLTISKYIEANAEGGIEIVSLSASTQGFSAGLSSLVAYGSAYIYLGPYTELTAGGGITIVSLSISASGSQLSVAYATAGGSASVYLGTHTNIEAGGYIVVHSLFAYSSGASLSLGSLQAAGGASIHLGSYISVMGYAGISLRNLEASYSDLSGSLSSLSAGGSLYLHLSGNNIDLQASAGVSLDSLHVTGDIKVDIGSLSASGKVDLSTAPSFEASASAGLNIEQFRVEASGNQLKFSSLHGKGSIEISSSESFSIIGDGSIAFNDFSILLKSEQIDGEASISSFSLSGEGSLSIGKDIRVQCSASLSIGYSYITYNDTTVTINSISINGGGHLTLAPLENGADFDISGNVDWSISSTALISHGNVSIDAHGNIKVINDGIHFDMTVGSGGGRATIYVQVDSSLTFDLENFNAPEGGTLLIEGTKSSNRIDVYADNNLGATWSHFAISTFAIGATIENFDGDIHAVLQSQGNTAHVTLSSQKGISLSTGILGFINGGISLSPNSYIDTYVDLIYSGGTIPDYIEFKFVSSGEISANVDFQLPTSSTLTVHASVSSADIYFKYDKNHPEDTVLNPADLDKDIKVYFKNLLVWPPSWFYNNVVLYAKSPHDTVWKEYQINAEAGDTIRFKAKILGMSNSNQVPGTETGRVTTLGSESANYIYEFIWGDGSEPSRYSSDEKEYETLHTYTRNGSYIARVNVFDHQNNELIGSDTIVIYIGESPSPPPSLNVSLSVDKRICYVGEEIEFTAEVDNDDNNNYVTSLSGGGTYTYVFYFKDGTTYEETTNSKICRVKHRYGDWGLYQPKVEVASNVDNKTGSSAITVIVYRSPYSKLDVEISANPLSPKINEQITFTVSFSENNNNADADNQNTEQSGVVTTLTTTNNGRYYIVIDYGDGDRDETYTDSTTVVFHHSYKSSETYNVKAFVFDQETGKSGDAGITIYVGGSSDNNIEIEPDHINLGRLDPGETVTGSFTVSNRGLQQVSWEVAEVPVKGTWILNPQTGILKAGESTTVDYIFTAPDTQNTDLDGYIKIWNTENHSDYDIISIIGTTPYVNDQLPPKVIFSNKPYIASEENDYYVKIYVGNSYDPDGGQIIKMRWDANGDGSWDTPLGMWIDFSNYFECDLSDQIPNNNQNYNADSENYNNYGGYVTSLSDTGKQQFKEKIVFVKVQIKDDDGQIGEGTTQVIIKYPVDDDNHAPVARANGPYSIDEETNPNLEVTFSAEGSHDPDDDPIEYRWIISGHGVYVDSGWITSETFIHSFKDDLEDAQSTMLSSQYIKRDKGYSPLKIFIQKLIDIITKIFGENSRIAQLIRENDVVARMLGSNQQQSSSNLEKIFNVKLEVRDNKGASASDTTTLTIRLHQNQPPVADAGGPYSANEDDGAVIYFDASNSYDPDGYITGYRWDFDGDGEWDTGWLSSPHLQKSYIEYIAQASALSSHEQQAKRIFYAKLEVKDDDGATDQDIATVTVYLHQNQKPNAKFSYYPSSPRVGDCVYFYDHSSDEDGYIVFRYWDFGDDTSSTLKNPKHYYDSPGTYTVTLTVTDNSGASDTCTKQITVLPQVGFPEIQAGVTKVGTTYAKIKVYLKKDGNDYCDVYLYLKKEGDAKYSVVGEWYNKQAPFNYTKRISNLESGTKYYYYAKAVNSRGAASTVIKSFTTDSSCFLAGTKILMANGSYKNIETIKVGDVVKAFDFEKATIVDAKVTKVYHHPPEEAPPYYLVINGELRVTPNHLMFINGRWLPAGEVKLGDELYGMNGETIIVTSIQKVFSRCYTYNLEVETYHNYFADNILVHNSKGGGGTSGGGSND